MYIVQSGARNGCRKQKYAVVSAGGMGGGHVPMIIQRHRGNNKGGLHEEKSPALMAEMTCGAHAIYHTSRIRRLTPTECARLQTIPEWYEWICSETQQYRMLGNGWTVEVIKHILSYGKWI